MIRLGTNLGKWLARLCLLLPLVAHAATTKTELAGNPLAQYPFFEYVRAFNVNAAVNIAIDPTRFPGDRRANLRHLRRQPQERFRVGRQSRAERCHAGRRADTRFRRGHGPGEHGGSGRGLDIERRRGRRPGRAVRRRSRLSTATAPERRRLRRRPCRRGRTSTWSPTRPRPARMAVTEQIYNLDSGVASGFGIPGGSSSARTSTSRPISRRWGDCRSSSSATATATTSAWYDHIGNHLASYGYIVMSHRRTTPAPGPDRPRPRRSVTPMHSSTRPKRVRSPAARSSATSIRTASAGSGTAAAPRASPSPTTASSTARTCRPTSRGRTSGSSTACCRPTSSVPTAADPHDANYHLWTASGDADVNGSRELRLCARPFTCSIAPPATSQSTIVPGRRSRRFPRRAGSGRCLHGPCQIGRATTHLIQLGYLLPLVKHYVEGNVPALRLPDPAVRVASGRSACRRRPLRRGSPTSTATAPPRGNFVIDDFQTNAAPRYEQLAAAPSRSTSRT